MILEIERGSTRSHAVENSIWKRLWTCRKADYVMNDHTCDLYIKISLQWDQFCFLISKYGYNTLDIQEGSQDNIVTVVTSLRAGQLRKCGSIPSRCKTFFSSQMHPYRLWSPPSLILMSNGGCFPRGKASWA
jgi:hypothetical protein